MDEIKVGRTKNFPRDMYPVLVAFKNINNAKSVMEGNSRNISAIFGDGVSIDSLTLTLVSEPMTSGIASVIPWLCEYSKNIFNLNGGCY
jgi:hypothetical protein